MAPTYKVLCADAECRHAAPFATATAAARWLEQHIETCGGVDYHEVEVTDVNGIVWPPVDARALPIKVSMQQLATAS